MTEAERLREEVDELRIRAERAEHERDEISASLAMMDEKWRHAYNRLREYEDANQRNAS